MLPFLDSKPDFWDYVQAGILMIGIITSIILIFGVYKVRHNFIPIYKNIYVIVVRCFLITD